MKAAVGAQRLALGKSFSPLLPRALLRPQRAALSAVRCRSTVRHTVRACGASEGEDKFTITTPLYYVNAAPHMGSAYPTMAADALARFNRMRGKRVSFVTGTDEHGEKIAAAAEARDMSPQEHCDDIAESYKSLWSKLDIEYDSFVRTTDSKHEALVQQVLGAVWDKGDIYKASYDGHYCVGCEEYKDDDDMDEDKNCLIHRAPCEFRSEENYFFKLSKYQKELEGLVLESDEFVQPDFRRNEVKGWVEEGARDFSISRAAVEWGIPIDRDPKQTVYVWFDALLGYISGLLPEGTEPTPENIAKAGWPADVHIIGKDILRFHAVYWPGMLLSAGLPLPGKVFGHGFLTKDGLKMGKSLGNTLEPNDLVDAYGPDAVRYYFLKEISFGNDGDFSEARFRDIVNANLANDIGNLLNRSLNLLKKNCDSKMPGNASSIPADHPLVQLVAEKPGECAAALDAMRFGDAMDAVKAISGRGNQLMEETAPWTALKKGTDEEKAEAALTLLAVVESVRVVAVMLKPVTPSLSQRIYAQLGYDEDAWAALSWDDASWGGLQEGHEFPKPKPVFQRLEGDFVVTPELETVSA